MGIGGFPFNTAHFEYESPFLSSNPLHCAHSLHTIVHISHTFLNVNYASLLFPSMILIFLSLLIHLIFLFHTLGDTGTSTYYLLTIDRKAFILLVSFGFYILIQIPVYDFIPSWEEVFCHPSSLFQEEYW